MSDTTEQPAVTHAPGPDTDPAVPIKASSDPAAIVVETGDATAAVTGKSDEDGLADPAPVPVTLPAGDVESTSDLPTTEPDPAIQAPDMTGDRETDTNMLRNLAAALRNFVEHFEHEVDGEVLRVLTIARQL